MSLDVRTLALMLAIVTLVTAIVLYLFYRLLPDTPGLKQAAIGAAFQSAASLFMIARDFIPPVISIASANGFYLLSYAFYYQAARLLSNHQQDWRWSVIIIVLLLPLVLIFPTPEYVGLRIILFSIGIAALCFMTSRILLKEISANLPARRGASFAIAGVGLISVYRIFSTLLIPPGAVPFWDINSGSIIFIAGIISSIIYAFAIIVMTSERLRVALKGQFNELKLAHHITDNTLREHKNFLAMLSHEFRTPLGIIKANIDAIYVTQKLPDKFTDVSLKRISNASTRLTTLVEGCLNDEWISNTIERGEINQIEINLHLLLSELCDEYSVKFSNNCDTEAKIIGDHYLITILFSSLIDNAKKYTKTPEGVDIRCHNKGKQFVIEISDDGPGIPIEERTRIFGKYYRAHNTNKQPGTGLGLFFVKKIIEQHDGKIEIEQQNGALFRITLPALGDIE